MLKAVSSAHTNISYKISVIGVLSQIFAFSLPWRQASVWVKFRWHQVSGTCLLHNLSYNLSIFC